LAETGENLVIERLANGVPVTALGIRSGRTAEVARLARASGHDVIWVDLEHGAMPVDVVADICHCALDLGLVPMVRVPEREYGVIGRVLDGGALGIIAPRIETAVQAADVVAACRFPPLGHRSAVGTLPVAGYRRLPAATLFETANRATIVEVLIESPLGVDNLEAIAAVPGVDLVGIGTNDLSAELGVPGEARHPRVRAAHERALRACQRAGKPMHIGGIADVGYSAELIRLGAAPFLMTGIDTDLLLSAAHERVRQALASVK
jgi:4-hydroxy-2-oxoheptanedioate aldolase